MFEELKQRLDGPFYTVFTPFAEDQSVDYDVLAAYLDHLYNGGARRFYVMAYNSRYSQMTTAEIYELNAFVSRHLKALDTQNIVIVADPIHCSTQESLDFALHAKEVGADLISLIVREKHFTDEQILEHFRIVGEGSQFPLLVHEMPFLSGFNGQQMHWPTSLLSALTTIPQIAALKEDAKDRDITLHALSLEPQIKVIIAGGGKRAFSQYYPDGARSWLNGISIIDAEICEVYWDALQKGDNATVDFVHSELEAPFFDGVCKKYGWHRTNKALLQAAGLMHRRDRMPLQHLTDAEYAEVKEVADKVAAAWNKWKEARK